MDLSALQQARAARRALLLAALGHPQRRLAVVNVAGTNGKGSTAAILAAILRAAGKRVGRYTSPDLHGPHERFWLDGACMAPAELAARQAAIAPAIAAAEAAFPHLAPIGAFERWTAIAWSWLVERGVEIAVVEAGIGGATDATNVCERPLAVLYGPIGLDHEAQLGCDLRAIVANKAGLLRPGVPTWTSATGEAADLLAAEASRIGAPLARVAPLAGRPTPEGGWLVELGDGAPPAHLALPGRYQLQNAALAVAAARALGADGTAVRRGLAEVVWPGRLERLADPAGGAWLLDGAHNADAIEALAACWGEPEPAVVVAGFRLDKAAGPMVRRLTAGGRPLVLCPVPGAASWEAAALAADADGPLVAAADLEHALALARAAHPEGLRLVTGSLWLVGAARERLLDRPKTPVPAHGAA